MPADPALSSHLELADRRDGPEVDRGRPGIEADVDQPHPGARRDRPMAVPALASSSRSVTGLGRERDPPVRAGREDAEQATALGRVDGEPVRSGLDPRARARPWHRRRRSRPTPGPVAMATSPQSSSTSIEAVPAARVPDLCRGTALAPWFEPQAPAFALNPPLSRPPTMSPNVAATTRPPTNAKRVRDSSSPMPSPIRIIGQSVQRSRTCESLRTPARTSRGIEPARIRKTPQPRAPRRTCMTLTVPGAVAVC